MKMKTSCSLSLRASRSSATGTSPHAIFWTHMPNGAPRTARRRSAFIVSLRHEANGFRKRKSNGKSLYRDRREVMFAQAS